MIKIHKEGRLIVALTILILLTLIALSARFFPYQVNYLTALFSGVILVLVLRFFRVPGRRMFKDEKTILAPSDGKVVVIEKVQQDEFIHGPCIQVSIFMSIHDVHINYFPTDGNIAYFKYHPGKYLVARHPKSSSLNERSSIGIETPYGAYLLRQVAGYVARRIRSYTRQGGKAIQGKEMGFIKFGSRLDLFLPLSTDIKVELNQRVTGGLTPVARFK
ncbi:MAG: phosphatidylserine decarboxylase family protein [Bacteroidota bacterium]